MTPATRRIDKAGSARLIPRVFPTRRLAALLLIALWLPALLHCRLEAAGIFFDADCCDRAPGAPPPAAADKGCAQDSCAVAEGEFTSPAAASLSVPAPVLCAVFIGSESLCPTIAVRPPPATGIVEAAAAPPEVKCAWVFVTRAALPPRAP